MQDGQGHNVLTEFVKSSGMSWDIAEDQSTDRVQSIEADTEEVRILMKPVLMMFGFE